MSVELILSPQPKTVEPAEGVYALPENGFIVLIADKPADMLFSAQWLKDASGRDWQITADTGGNPCENVVKMVLCAEGHSDQGYALKVSPEGIEIRASDLAGIFYGVCTVCQLFTLYPDAIPAMSIRDWPDFPVRGILLDISRDKVPTLETLKQLVDMLAGWKINHLELYMEHTFAYRNHETVWKNASPMTAEEILILDAYCRERFIDLTPNQNSFSHWSRWFDHEEYIHLANTRGVTDTPDGPLVGSFTLNPVDPESIALLSELYDELLPNFTSPYFNVGCDEAYDLELGLAAETSKKLGWGRVYLDFLLKIYEQVKKHDRTMLFWGDIMLHHPDLIPELPKDAIALQWGYEPDELGEGSGKAYRDAGLQVWMCPGTSSWMSMAGKSAECMANLRNAGVNGMAGGASGYLNTDWGDNGHWQYLPVSFLGFLYGAAVSWNSSDDGHQIAEALSLYAFNDKAGLMGKLVVELGKVHENIAKRMKMGTFIWKQLATPLSNLSAADDITAGEFDRAYSYAESILSQFANTQMKRPDAELIKAEYTNAGRQIKLGCILGKIRLTMKEGGDASTARSEAVSLLMTIMSEHDRLWAARNKPGGLVDSRARMETRLSELQ